MTTISAVSILASGAPRAMRRCIAAALIVSALAGQAARADPPDVHYAPAENLERIDVDLLDDAGETIDIAAYVLTDLPVIESLRMAAERGVKVRVYRWRDEREPGQTIVDALASLAATPSVEVRFKRGSDLMHLKSYCVDGRLLRAGAANFSASGLKRQDNDLVIFRGPGVCDRFEADFARMWGAE